MRKILAVLLSFILAVSAAACCGESAAADGTFTLGNIEGFVYTNEYLGLGCELDGWHFDSAGEIAQMNAQQLGMLPENLEEFVREKQSFILMFAESENKMQNANISVTYSPGAEADVQRTGMKTIVTSLYPQFTSMQTSLGRKNARVSVASDRISNEDVYGFDVIYEDAGTDIYQRGIMLGIKDYVITITATGGSTTEVESIIHRFFFIGKENSETESGTDTADPAAGGKQQYTGKLQPIRFEVPNEWEQQTLSQEYNTLEAKFVLPGGGGTMIQYACQDLVTGQGLPESMRSFFSTGYFSEDDIRAYYEGMVSDLTVEKTKIGDLDCFVARGTYGFAITWVLFFDEGYFHQLSLYETDNSKLAEHEKVLFDVVGTVKLPGGDEAVQEFPLEAELGEIVGNGNAPSDGSGSDTFGPTVLFGSYDQDNDLSNGNEKIEWIVLDERDGKSLLLSKYSLDSQLYGRDYFGDTTWADSSIREWLNGSFLDRAFSDREKEQIATTYVKNDSVQGYGLYNTIGGEDTEDQVFLLSYHEVFDLYLPDETARQCAPTDTAIECGARASDMCYFEGRGTWAWWLRSPGDSQYCAAVVKYDGSIGSESATAGHIAVRPAIWVNSEAIRNNPASGENEPAEAPTVQAPNIRNEKLDAAFESGTLKLVPSDAEAVAFDVSNVEISEGLKAFLNKEGMTEDALRATIGNLQASEIQVVSVSPGGHSGFLQVQGTGVSFFDGTFHMLYPSAERSVADTYSNLEDYYRQYIATNFSRLIGPEGVIYSSDGKYAAVYNVWASLNSMRTRFAPIIIDLSTGELILTAAYPSGYREEGYGFVTSAAFSGDNGSFYYALMGHKGDARIRLFRYDMNTGETEECIRSAFDVYLLPRMYQIGDRSFMMPAQVATSNEREGIVNFFRDGDEWKMYTHQFSFPAGYFSPQSLHYSDNSGYAALIGSLQGINSGSYAFQVFSPGNNFEGFDRYLCISTSSDEVTALTAEEYRALADQYSKDKTSFPYRYIFDTAMSPDGNYLLVNANGLPDFTLFLIRLEDLAIRRVEVPEEENFLRRLAISAGRSAGIEWNTENLLILADSFATQFSSFRIE